MIKTLFCAVLLGVVVSCAPIGTGARLTPESRVLLLCEGWANIFRRVNLRDTVGIATRSEISAINAARPVMNPTCLNLSVVSGMSLDDLEIMLADVIRTSRKEE